MRDQILDMQVRMRLDAIHSNYPAGSSQVVLLNEEPAGWLVVSSSEAEVRLVEIVVSARHRGQGIGALLIGEVIAQSASSGKPLRLLVEVMNSGACRLYERLGFRRIGGDQIQHLMEYAGAT
jgi:ribosomal protein S18 acetylase RimI-like enzyme